VYSVFGDESADETKSRVFAVAGVFGGEPEWIRLKGAWLERTGGKIFHAADCETNQGEFVNTSNSENKALYKDLTILLCGSHLLGRGHAIELCGVREFFQHSPAELPYCMCFRNVVHQCGNLALLSIPQEKVEFTFDQRAETNYNAGVLYDYMAKVSEWNASPYLHDKINFASRKYVGIQVADLLARETMKHLDNIIGPVKRDTRRSMKALNATGRFRFTFWNREWFEGLHRNFQQVASRFGVDLNEYPKWLLENGLVDNLSNRHQHMRETFPPETGEHPFGDKFKP
jgi:hypothetical protein